MLKDELGDENESAEELNILKQFIKLGLDESVIRIRI